MLLLHGFPQHAGEWDASCPALHAAGLRTYALDQRGYSPGARPDRRSTPTGWPSCVADAVAVLDALGVDVGARGRPRLGRAWSAWRLAAEHPDRVRTLTAVSVPHPAAMAHALATDPSRRPGRRTSRCSARRARPSGCCWRWTRPALRRMLGGVGDGDRVRPVRRADARARGQLPAQNRLQGDPTGKREASSAKSL